MSSLEGLCTKRHEKPNEFRLMVFARTKKLIKFFDLMILVSRLIFFFHCKFNK